MEILQLSGVEIVQFEQPYFALNCSNCQESAVGWEAQTTNPSDWGGIGWPILENSTRLHMNKADGAFLFGAVDCQQLWVMIEHQTTNLCHQICEGLDGLWFVTAQDLVSAVLRNFFGLYPPHTFDLSDQV